jgi:hypothetical protein
MAVVALLVVVLTSLLIRLAPGDPARTILGQKATPEQIDALRQQLGLDAPMPSQVGSMLWGVLRGDLGSSLVDRGRSVISIVMDAVPITLTLIALTVVISALVGIALGLWGALTRYRAVDEGVSALDGVWLPQVVGATAGRRTSPTYGCQPLPSAGFLCPRCCEPCARAPGRSEGTSSSSRRAPVDFRPPA